MSILKIKNLKKIYHTSSKEFMAVRDVSFDLDDGEFIAIVGPSGCGKSTILEVLCNLVDKSDGLIDYNDDLKFGYMLQSDNLFEWRSIYKNCLLGLEIQNNFDSEDYVINLLKAYGLYEFKDSYPSELSGGMRQRVSLIRTLATKPDILLLDEPFSALDAQTRLAVSDDVYRIIKKEKISTIMVTHDISEAISMADKVIVLSSGPSEVKSVYKIDLKNKKTPIENRKDEMFSYYYEKIWKDIDYHV